MRVDTLKRIINHAQYHESKTQCLREHLKHHLKNFPQHLKIEQGKELSALTQFAMEYIEHVPQFLADIKNAAQQAGIEAHVYPFLKVAEDYFINPPLLPNDHLGLMALMDEAYLAHRLFEEINDRYIARVGLPLIPWDMTLANVIAHQLVGEELANDLDQQVHGKVEKMMPQEISYQSSSFKQYLEKAQGNTTSIWQHWPCLGEASGIQWALQ